MTEIDDLAAFLGRGQQQGPPLTGAQREHIEYVTEYERAVMLERMSLVQFFAPVLCTCSMQYDRESPYPPQVSCPVHSILMAHPYTGQPVMPGMPMSPGTFTPGQEAPHDEE